MEKMVTFNLKEQEFCIKVSNISSIEKVPEITSLPQSNKYIEGIIDLRGEIISVLNLKTIFGIDSSYDKEIAKLIVLDLSGKKTALLVDSANNVIDVDLNEKHELPLHLASIQYFEGLLKIEGNLVTIINASSLLHHLKEEI